MMREVGGGRGVLQIWEQGGWNELGDGVWMMSVRVGDIESELCRKCALYSMARIWVLG